MVCEFAQGRAGRYRAWEGEDQRNNCEDCNCAQQGCHPSWGYWGNRTPEEASLDGHCERAEGKLIKDLPGEEGRTSGERESE